MSSHRCANDADVGRFRGVFSGVRGILGVMPFTPFHMGAGLIAKAGLDKRISLISFGLAQVAIDIEPGLGMLNDAEVLHGWSHTLWGAILIGLLVTLISAWPIRWIVGRWNREVSHYGANWLSVDLRCDWRVCAAGAFVGTLSHIALDSIIHADMQPLAPLAATNPMLGLIGHDNLYLVCALAAVVGGALWLARKWLGRDKAT